MTAFIIAALLGTLVAIAYLGLALRSFLRIRRQLLGGGREELGSDEIYASQGRDFTWKAALGVLASIAVISGLALGGGWWYLVPFLAIGSAIAVVVAFLVDESSSDAREANS